MKRREAKKRSSEQQYDNKFDAALFMQKIKYKIYYNSTI